MRATCTGEKKKLYILHYILINSRHEYKRNQLKIYVGFTNLDDAKSTSILLSGTDIESIKPAPQFSTTDLENGNLLTNDYGVIKVDKSPIQISDITYLHLKLTGELAFGASLRPVCLSRELLSYPHRQHHGTLIMAGWGLKKGMAVPPKVLQTVTVPIQNNEECARFIQIQ